MTKLLSRLLFAAFLAGVALPAFAQVVNADAVVINANVIAKCTVTTLAADVTLPDWSPTDGAPTGGSTQYQLRCTRGTAMQVSVSGGNGGADDGMLRSMVGPGTELLGYKLSVDAAANPELAVDTGTAVAGTAPGRGTDWNINLYVTPADVDAAVGAYTDTVLVTLSIP